MRTDELRTLYAHAAWANRRVVAAAGRLPAAEFSAAAHPGFGSVGPTLVHVLNAERTWLARARGLSAPGDLDPGVLPDVTAIRAAWEPVEAETRAYVAGLDEAGLAETVRYVNAAGEPNAYPRWQILVHQAMHAAQHRSEIALVLTQLGASPGWLDFLFFLDVTRGDNRGG